MVSNSYNKTFIKPLNESQENNRELLVFMVFTVRNSAGKRSTNATFARLGKLQNNIQENKLARHQRFRGAGKQLTNITFSWYLPLVIQREKRWENAAIARSENFSKMFRKTSYTVAFSWNRKTIGKHHVFMAFTVSYSAGKRLENAAFARTGKLQKNVQENKLLVTR